MKLALGGSVIGTVGAIALFAASNPFAGTWFFEPAKSDLRGQLLHIYAAGPSQYRLEFADKSSVVLPEDGTVVPSPMGGTASIKRLNENSWRFSTKKSAMETISTFVVSADKNTMKCTVEEILANGAKTSATSSWHRMGTGTGLAAEWAMTNFNADTSWSAREMRIEALSPNGLSIGYPANRWRVDFQFDGKDYPEIGPNATKGSTVAGKRINSLTFALDGKLNGKPWDFTEYKVSESGKTLNLRYHDLVTDKWQSYVFEKR